MAESAAFKPARRSSGHSAVARRANVPPASVQASRRRAVGGPQGLSQVPARRSTVPAPPVPEVLRGSGQSMAVPLTEEMRGRPGADFSHVPVHTDSARATSGPHVVNGPASEFTHVTKQHHRPAASIQLLSAADRRPGTPADAAVVRQTVSSGGLPLAAPVRDDMEGRFAADFSSVRVHTGAGAARSARAVAAAAYTAGEHIVLGGRVPSLASGTGRAVLAHELAHVVQQRAGPVRGSPVGDDMSVSDPQDSFERAADDTARAALAGRADHPGRAPSPPGHLPQSAGAVRRYPSPGQALHVQRAVGFEFEAQWNVRNVSEQGMDAHRIAKGQREDAIATSVLNRLLFGVHEDQLDPTQGHPKAEPEYGRGQIKVLALSGLDQDEKKKTPDELRSTWFTEGVINADGRERAARWKSANPNVWDARALAMQGQHEIGEEPLEGRNLHKRDKVVTAKDYDLEADTSPSGGSNLEWVTDPLETQAQVEAVMSSLTKMVRHLNSQKEKEFIPSEDFTAVDGQPVPELRIYPDKKELSFEPQTTVGLRIDQLPALIDYLNPPPKGLLPWPPSVARRKAHSDLFETVGIKVGSDTKMSDALEGARGAVEGAKKIAAFLQPPGARAGLEGLVALLASYLMTGDKLAPGANAKSIASGLMARTDFAHNFSQLNGGLQVHYRAKPDEFAALVLAAAGMSGRGSETVFRNTVERGATGERIETKIPLTRQAWLENIPAGKDLMKNFGNLSSEEKALPVVAGNGAKWEAIHKSLGSLPSEKAGNVGPAQMPAVVAEFRRMRDGLTVDQLTPLAVAVFKLIEQVNAGRKASSTPFGGESLRYEK